jgi:nucleoid-associated protein YgaU
MRVGRRGKASLLAATLALSSLGLPAPALAQRNPRSPPAASLPDGGRDRVDRNDRTQPDNPAAEDDAPIGGENLIEPDPDDGREQPDPTPLSELAPEQPGQEIDVAPEAEPQPETAPAPAETAPAPVEPPVPVTPAPQPEPAPAFPVPLPSVQPTTPPPAGELSERLEGEPARDETRRVLIGVEPKLPAVGEESPASLSPAEPNAPAAPVDEQATPLAATPMRAAEPTPATSARAAAAPVLQPSSARPREIRGHTYTVRPGDSLWSIARRLLGQGASPADIAREVSRLWELNRERIATGDPDLLMVGTKLRLR